MCDADDYCDYLVNISGERLWNLTISSKFFGLFSAIVAQDHSEDPLCFSISTSLLLARFNSSGGSFIFLIAASMRAIAALISRFNVSIVIG